MQNRPKVGEILVQAGIIDEMQLQSALGEQSRWGRRLGVTLIKMGMVEEGQLIRALAKQLDLPVASLAGKRIPDEVIALVPSRMATEHGVVPLFTKDEGRAGQLYLGMEDPSNLEVLDDLSFRTGMEILPVMVGPSELGEAIDRYYLGAPGRDEDDAFRPGETLGEQALRKLRGGPPTAAPAEADSEAAPVMPASRDEEIEWKESPPAAAVPQDLLDDVARALEESERTRIVARAVTQLLVDKGVLTIDEIQACVTRIKASADGS